jgi:GT2 family glycosyltransferase
MAPAITVSVVSHRQNELASQFLRDLHAQCSVGAMVLVTLNAADPFDLVVPSGAMPVDIVVNKHPKGFGANHNAAFLRCRTPFFCVANPDIRLSADPFAAMLSVLGDERVGVAGPLVRNSAGEIEDSARRFPTVATLLRKVVSNSNGPDYPTDRGAIEVDWVGGMFMLFRSEAFRALNGFDERYFLYYEDVDLCRRMRRQGRSVIYNPLSQVIHDARRGSRRDLRLTKHHLASLVRYLASS